MGTPEKPYEWGHPQFDPVSHAQWQEFKRLEPYVKEHGLVFVRPEPSAVMTREYLAQLFRGQ